MTAPHSGPVALAPDAEAALEVMRAAGLRVSTARRLTIEALYGADRPLTAEQIAADVAGGDVASVYRNLERLERVGIVRHFHLGHSPSLYVRAGAGVQEYLVCESCQVVKAVAPDELDGVREQLRDRFGWQARFTHDPVVGLCRDCQEATE